MRADRSRQSPPANFAHDGGDDFGVGLAAQLVEFARGRSAATFRARRGRRRARGPTAERPRNEIAGDAPRVLTYFIVPNLKRPRT